MGIKSINAYEFFVIQTFFETVQNDCQLSKKYRLQNTWYAANVMYDC